MKKILFILLLFNIKVSATEFEIELGDSLVFVLKNENKKPKDNELYDRIFEEIDIQPNSYIKKHKYFYLDNKNFWSKFDSVTIIFKEVGFYTITITPISINNGGGSLPSVSHLVIVKEKKEPWNVYIPNVFSPNDDGTNDEFYPFTEFPYYMEIYDRWGNLAYRGTEPYTGSNIGVFTYVIIINNKKYKGTVTALADDKLLKF